MSSAAAVSDDGYHGDVSGCHSVPLYTSFVLALLTAASAILVAVPVWLFYRSSSCRGLGGCFSLERDLLGSIDHSVHPCDDFYGHVCGRWDSRKTGYRGPPADRYRAHFTEWTAWSLLKRNIPKWPRKALDKACSMLVHCLQKSDSESSDALRQFLLEVGLSWPRKSRSTRQQLLESLVTLSLDIGMPTLWKIAVGRHPSLPAQNTLYMSLDSRFHAWSEDVQVLRGKGNLHRYLRRCAEVVGGKGESYSAMITDVQTIHRELSDIVQRKKDSEVSPLLGALPNDTARFWSQLHSSIHGFPVVANLSRSERSDLTTWSLAVAAAVHALVLHETKPWVTPRPGSSRTFPGIPPDRLFFLVVCFMECGRSGRSRSLKETLCNLALPTVPNFRKAFHCTARHRLTTKFTWRDAAARQA